MTERLRIALGSQEVRLGEVEELIRANFPGFKVEKDDHLAMDEEYYSWVRTGSRTSSIRYAKGVIRVPVANRVKLIKTKIEDPTSRNHVGFLRITRVTVKRFDELTNEDAKNDGFDNTEQLAEVLQDFYDTEIEDSEPVSIFEFKFEPRR